MAKHPEANVGVMVDVSCRFVALQGWSRGLRNSREQESQHDHTRGERYQHRDAEAEGESSRWIHKKNLRINTWNRMAKGLRTAIPNR